MSKKPYCFPGYLLFSIILLTIACKDPISPPPSDPDEVTDVSVSPATVEVAKGQQQQFTATVTVTGNAEKTVNWTVTGESSQTGITTSGLLTVGADETAATLTVTATSTYDDTKKGDATVTVTDTGGQTEKLPAPEIPALSNQGLASWTALEDETNVTGYTVQLLKDNSAVTGEDASATVAKGQTYSHNFLSVMRTAGPGAYTVKVTANGNNTGALNSDPSAASNSQNVTRRPTVTGLNWSGDTATWTASSGTVVNYRVKLYRDNNPTDKENTQTTIGKDFSGDIISLGNGLYTFTVTALGDNFLVLDSAESDKSPANVILNDIWLVGTMNDWTLPGTPMTKQSDGTFTWENDITADSTFRFSLIDTTGWIDIWNGNWFAPAANNTAVTFDNTENAITLFSTNTSEGATSATDNAWTIPAGYYKFILKPAANPPMLRVERPVIVDTITISSHPTQVFPDREYSHFDVTFTGGKNTDLAVVLWRVSGASSSGTKFGTGIDFNRLTVADDEDVTSLLSVTAESGGKTSEAVTIQVEDPLSYGEAVIGLTLTDQGGALTVTGVPSTMPVIYKTGGTLNEDRLLFEVDSPNGTYTYTWYVDGAANTGTSITFNAANYTVGYHSVRLTVTINNVPWSMPDKLGFTVVAVKQ